jgi:capsular exopolysaccharide synthesis family protein
MDNSAQNQQQIFLQEEEGIDIKKYVFLILSHWWWFAISIFISLTIAYMINRYSQEIYSASCSLIVGEEEPSAGSIESLLDEFSRVKNKKRKAVVENEISILKSYTLARQALEELDFGVTYTAVGRRNIAETQLYKNSPFIVIPDTTQGSKPAGSYYLTILSDTEYRLSIDDQTDKIWKFGERFERSNSAFMVQLRNPDNFIFDDLIIYKYFFSINSINSQANRYSRSLGVEVNAEKGSILSLNMTGFVPLQITDYLNKLSEVYIRMNLREKNQASINTIRFIDDQLRGIVDSLEATGLRLQHFRSANKVIDISKEGSFLFQKMQDLQSEKAMLDINSRYYNYLVEYIQKKTDFSDVVAPSVIGIQDQLLNTLVSQLNRLNMERRNLNLSVMENSPQLTLVNTEITNTRNALQENLSSLVSTNRIAMTELDERIGKIEKEVKKLPGTERQLINIEREFTINDQIYTFLLEKRAEAGITRASNTSDHKILDIARPENASLVKPKTSSNYMMGLIAGAGIPLALMLLVEYFNTKITDRKYLESRLKAPVLGNIGHSEGSTELPIAEKPGSSIAESFRALRTNLDYILHEKEKGVIAVTSAISGEGKTFCSVNLATIFALNGKKTLLISLDLRRPKIHRVFNIPNVEGMSTYLIGKTEPAKLIIETNIHNLYVATSGPIPPNPSELIGSKRMKLFMDEAKKSFDYIIVDTPPLAIVSDTLILKDLLDSLVFVIRHNYSDKQVVELVNSIYQKNLMQNLCVVVNDIQLQGYYGYTYRYGYGYGYSYSYKEAYYNDETDRQTLFGKILRRMKLN